MPANLIAAHNPASANIANLFSAPRGKPAELAGQAQLKRPAEQGGTSSRQAENTNRQEGSAGSFPLRTSKPSAARADRAQRPSAANPSDTAQTSRSSQPVEEPDGGEFSKLFKGLLGGKSTTATLPEQPLATQQATDKDLNAKEIKAAADDFNDFGQSQDTAIAAFIQRQSRLSGEFNALSQARTEIAAQQDSDNSQLPAAETPLPTAAISAMTPVLANFQAQSLSQAKDAASQLLVGHATTEDALSGKKAQGKHGLSANDKALAAALNAASANGKRSAAAPELPFQLAVEAIQHKDAHEQPQGAAARAIDMEHLLLAARPSDGSAGRMGQAPIAHQPPPQAMTTQVGTIEWGKELGARVMLMTHRNEGRAELVLTPAELGRIEVNLSVSGDKATASFVSANPLVREALEAAMPRLRESLAEAGIQLGQAQVGSGNDQTPAQQEKNSDNPRLEGIAGLSGTLMAEDDNGLLASAGRDPGLKVGRGLVDVFA